MLAGAVMLLVLVLGAGAALTWSYSDQVLVPDHSGWPEDVDVESVHAGRVVLERSDETLQPGVNGLDWQGGHAVLGERLAADSDTVTRRLLDVDGYLVGGMRAAIDWNVYAGNPKQALGVPFAPVRIRGQLGPMPAWLVPAKHRPAGGGNGTWAIFVHGIDSSPQTGLRMVRVLRRSGLPALYITYRNDAGAPSSPDGLHHLGLTEWRDVQSAARWALSHGARRLVLVGYSMGGALVTQFMERSKLAPRVRALILDAPVLDWRKTLELNATEQGWPALAAQPLEWAIGARIDVDWEALDALDHLDALRLPILLFHGGDDQIVPIETSEELAAALPRTVRYYRVPAAGHCQSWNVDPQLYDRRVSRFLAGLAKQTSPAVRPGSS